MSVMVAAGDSRPPATGARGDGEKGIDVGVQKDLDLDAMAAEYERGDSLPEVARRHGVAYETARRRLRDHGVRIRSVSDGLVTSHRRTGDLDGLASELDMPVHDLLVLLRRHGVIRN